MAKKDGIKDNKNNNFGKELKSELKKVTWPSFKQLANNTYAVIAIVLIVAVIVFAFDFCFENLNKFSVDKLKSIVSSNTEESIEESNDSENLVEETTEASDEENLSVEPSASVENDATATPTENVDASSTVETAPNEAATQGTENSEANVNQ